MNASPDFLIVGAGVIGLTLARELKTRFPDTQVVVIEKESGPAMHASGRNSGVLHAGFYYTANSLKARFSRLGNEIMRAYCLEKGLRINQCGKLVVAPDVAESLQVDELLRRAHANGVELQELNAAEARSIEPSVNTAGRILFSPTTASVDPVEVLASLERDLLAMGVVIYYGAKYLRAKGLRIDTARGAFTPRFFVNAAGLYADVIARDFGFSKDYRILPFKGLYLYANQPVGWLRTHIYPVPDLRNPFLGVHFTITVDGKAKIGPTAIPAFWRENYQGFDNFSWRETLPILGREAMLMLGAGFDFRTLAFAEMRKYSPHRMVQLASRLVTGDHSGHFRTWGKPGIRAQLLNIRTRTLEMDFVVESDDRSMHILNAVSPAFTCSIPFASHLADEITLRLEGTVSSRQETASVRSNTSQSPQRAPAEFNHDDHSKAGSTL